MSQESYIQNQVVTRNNKPSGRKPSNKRGSLKNSAKKMMSKKVQQKFLGCVIETPDKSKHNILEFNELGFTGNKMSADSDSSFGEESPYRQRSNYKNKRSSNFDNSASKSK